MANTPLPAAKLQFFDSNGDPLVGGKLFTYVPATLVDKLTYKDFAGTIQNTNPIILDARGETPGAVYGDGTYRLILKDSLDNTIWDTDTKSYATSLTSGEIIAALGYTPVDPAANVAFTGNNTHAGTEVFNAGVTFNASTTWTVAPSVNVPLNVTTDTLAILNVENGDDGATAAIADFYRNSASPAANDILYTLRTSGNSASGIKRTIAEVETELLDATNTSEDGRLNLKTIVAGTLSTRFRVGNGFYSSALNDPGAGIINAVQYQKNNVALPRQTRIVSSAITIVAGSANNFAHGLGVVPTIFGAYMVCVTAEQNYAVGDVIQLSSFGDNTSNRGISISANATNLTATVTASPFVIVNRTSGAIAFMTYANWQIYLWAETS